MSSDLQINRASQLRIFSRALPYAFSKPYPYGLCQEALKELSGST